MTLPVSGAISMSQVASELGIGADGLGLNDSRVRGLAAVGSGTISFSNLFGKSNFKVSLSSIDESRNSQPAPSSVASIINCSVSGGVGPYTYLWQQIGSYPGSSTSYNLPPSSLNVYYYSGVGNRQVPFSFQLKVTDNTGKVAFGPVVNGALIWL